MKRMTVRDIRLRWPEAERALEAEGEIIVTRDSKPVARILPFNERGESRRPRFDPKRQTQWIRTFWKAQPAPTSTDELLAADRGE